MNAEQSPCNGLRQAVYVMNRVDEVRPPQLLASSAFGSPPRERGIRRLLI
jgi:hypothetical protein